MPGKWDDFEELARRQQTGLTASGAAGSPLAPIEDKIETIRQKELDLIGRFKRKSIDRRAALGELQALHGAQLEATKHALKRAVDVEAQRVDTVANKYIFQITEEYLRYLRDLGLQNYESRMETLLQLNETTAKLLDRAQNQDVPPSVRELNLENIHKKYKEFTDKLMEDEVRLSH